MNSLVRRSAKVLYPLLLILMIIGTCKDETISALIYGHGLQMGRIFAVLTMYTWPLCAVTALALCQKAQVRGMILYTVVFSLIGGTIGFFREICRYSMDAVFPGMVMELLVSLIVYMLVYRSAKGEEELLRKTALLLALVPVCSLAITVTAKDIWMRPRYRTLINTEQMDFQNWYVIGCKNSAMLMKAGISREEFRSFPSGHATCATAVLAMVSLHRVIPALHKQESVLMCIALFWMMISVICRIIVGAHFLSDVTMGMTITLTVYLIMEKVIVKAKEKV